MNIVEDYSRANPSNVWRNYRYDMTRGADIAKYIARKRYAWPGGYELFAVTDDGGVLCHNCCKSEFAQIVSACPGDGWNVEAFASASELAESVVCDHCSKEITS